MQVIAHSRAACAWNRCGPCQLAPCCRITACSRGSNLCSFCSASSASALTSCSTGNPVHAKLYLLLSLSAVCKSSKCLFTTNLTAPSSHCRGPAIRILNPSITLAGKLANCSGEIQQAWFVWHAYCSEQRQLHLPKPEGIAAPSWTTHAQATAEP